MGNFSRNTFDKLKHYVGVRLQQGVPLVDADWNELDDIRRYELRSFIKWFVGDGIPKGNDGFRIYAIDKENDFGILGGDSTTDKAGRCLADGLEVIIEKDTTYASQVDDYKIPTEVNMLTTPSSDRKDVVYLDVWEREIESVEDPALINEKIGVETCVRTKREWLVLVAENSMTIPAPPDGHYYYPLALLSRKAGEGKIKEGMIKDLRRTGLTLGNIIDAAIIPRIESLEYYEQMLKKWYIGNGVPKDNEGFKIISTIGNRDNDFLIKAGRCLVNGHDIENKIDINYSAQVTTNAELLRTPTFNQKLLVYLESWKEDSTSKECTWKVKVSPWNTLELPPIFLPSFTLYKIFDFSAPRTALRAYAPLIAARSAMISLGRIPLTEALPAEIGFSWTDVDNRNIPTVSEIEEMIAPEVEAYERDGHHIYPLAFIKREVNNPKITDEMILDLRQSNLNLSYLTRRVENLESEVFFWDVTVTPEENQVFYGSPVEIDVEVNDAHGPRKDALVEFTTDFGSITPSSAVTDEFGRTKARLIGTILDETPTQKEITDLKEIHVVLKAAYAQANPNISSFLSNVKFSSSQMALLERHLPNHIYRNPLVDKAILQKPTGEITTKTATVNIRVKYSSERPITKGLGSTQVTFRQWIKPWLTYSIYSAFDKIKDAHVSAVTNLVSNYWDSAQAQLKTEFAPKLNAHMDGLQVNTKDNLVKNMVVEETSPALGGIGELVHDAVINITQEATVSAVRDTIGETSGVAEAISTALITSSQSVSVQKMKTAIFYKKPEIVAWSTSLSGPS